MEKNLRSAIGAAAQGARRLLESEYAEQLDGVFDIQRSGAIAAQPGAHLTPTEGVTRTKIVAAIAYHEAGGIAASEAVDRFIRDAAFTTLNRFVALKMLEARELIQPAITDGEASSGYREFTGLAPGVTTLGDLTGYRLYLESVFDELGTEVKVLFDRHDAASLLWPRRTAFEALLEALNTAELVPVWNDDETIGWFYQFFNSKEERQQMRDESQAPRNSRELAVRDQFFTPRYVVQFLVDNTLGRTWIEMADGDTSLTERCEYFVTLEEERPPRQIKDPRDFRILDPACGSGHFLLYCFDLLDVMYHEAWERGLGSEAASGESLRTTYPTLGDLERAIPSLIVERNLHGVDIDPRAAQIAALAIWLRAQRAWQSSGVDAADRPVIRRTGIVIAEPMPGDPELVAEFAGSLQPPLLSRLFVEMVQAMTLAGEMGALLRAEGLLADEIARARGEFVKQRVQPQTLPGFGPEIRQGELDLSGIDDDAFFAEAEERLLQALSTFVNSGVGGDSARRRMFADDSAQGVALLELVRMSFDVVLMNPPFGLMPRGIYDHLVGAYPDAYYDLAVTFMARGLELIADDGLVGAITSRAFLFVTDAERFRKNSALDAIDLLVDLGQGVMDGAAVSACAQVLSSRPTTSIQIFDAREEDDKAVRLRSAVQLADFRTVTTDEFRRIPGQRVAYEALDTLDKVFNFSGLHIEPDLAISRIGASTFDDDRFLRLRWEVDGPSDIWMTSSRSSDDFAMYFYPSSVVVNWANGGAEVCARNERVNGQVAQARQGSTHYGRPGLVFSRRSAPSISFRCHPAGASFASNTGVVLPNDGVDVFQLAGVLNSGPYRAAVNSIANNSYTVGHIKKLGWPTDSDALSEVGLIAADLFSLSASLYAHDETTHRFWPMGSLSAESSLVASFTALERRLTVARERMLAKSRRIDELVAEMLGIDDWPERAVEFGVDSADVLLPETRFRLSILEFLECCASFCIGLAFGRWDMTLGDGDMGIFDEVPSSPTCSGRRSEGVSFYLVDDSASTFDVVSHCDRVAQSIWASEETPFSDRFESETASNLRLWLKTKFFSRHLSAYTANRRAAPVYWQVGSKFGSITAWFYWPSLTRDSLHQFLNDYVNPRLEAERRRLEDLRNDDQSHRLERARQEAVVDDIHEFSVSVSEIAAEWKPWTRDGVPINAAGLRRILTGDSQWLRRVDKVRAALEEGELDWSATALQLKPERVIPKCAEDRSLAIAHNLEDVFWFQDGTNPDKWHPRHTPTAPIDHLITERSNPTIATTRDHPNP